jgi:hypothetical protein
MEKAQPDGPARRETGTLVLLLYAIVSSALSCALLVWILWRFVPNCAVVTVGMDHPRATELVVEASHTLVMSLPFLVLFVVVLGPLALKSPTLRALGLAALLAIGFVALPASFVALIGLNQGLAAYAQYVPREEPDTHLYRAAERLVQACHDGSALGCAALGTMHATGEGMRKPSRSFAEDLLQKACEGGSRCGCAELEAMATETQPGPATGEDASRTGG